MEIAKSLYENKDKTKKMIELPQLSPVKPINNQSKEDHHQSVGVSEAGSKDVKNDVDNGEESPLAIRKKRGRDTVDIGCN
jgi:hypothetical protein